MYVLQEPPFCAVGGLWFPCSGYRVFAGISSAVREGSLSDTRMVVGQLIAGACTERNWCLWDNVTHDLFVPHSQVSGPGRTPRDKSTDKHLAEAETLCVVPRDRPNTKADRTIARCTPGPESPRNNS